MVEPVMIQKLGMDLQLVVNQVVLPGAQGRGMSMVILQIGLDHYFRQLE